MQGLTEFLPVSSSGHLVLAEQLLAVRRPGLALETGLHLGTLLAVVWAYRRSLLRDAARLWAPLLLASMPAGVAGLLLRGPVDRLFGSVAAVGVALSGTGLAFLLVGPGRRGGRGAGSVRAGDALRIGLLQVLALAPGVSRSGVTILGGLLCGLEPGEAARFSFLMSLPAVGAAVALQAASPIPAGALLPLLCGAAAAAGVGVWAIGFCTAVVRRAGLRPFGWYCLAAGGLVLLRVVLG